MGNVARFLLIGCLVALPVAAQRGGGGHGGGRGGGSHGSGGGKGGGFRGHGFGRGFDAHNGSFFGFGYYPSYSWLSYSDYPDYGYGYPYYDWPSYYWGNDWPSYYWGYHYPSSYYNDSYSSPQVVVSQPDPAPVTVYERPPAVRPEVREPAEAYSEPDEKPIYLIAFKNSNILSAAEAYWVTGGTLHFITLQHEQREAPLDSVDRALTSRLNRQRHVDFHLPAAD